MDKDAELKAFLEERNAVLRSMDVDRIIEFHQKWNPSRPPMTREVAEIALHKARTACMHLTEDERAISEKWLAERGFSSFGDTP